MMIALWLHLKLKKRSKAEYRMKFLRKKKKTAKEKIMEIDNEDKVEDISSIGE